MRKPSRRGSRCDFPLYAEGPPRCNEPRCRDVGLISALVALFTNVLVSHATTSKLVLAMARDGQLPRRFAYISPKR